MGEEWRWKKGGCVLLPSPVQVRRVKEEEEEKKGSSGRDVDGRGERVEERGEVRE